MLLNNLEFRSVIDYILLEIEFRMQGGALRSQFVKLMEIKF